MTLEEQAAAEIARLVRGQTRFSGANGAEPPVLSYIRFGDIEPDLSDSYVVKDVLARGSFAAIIGAPGSGKTFLAADLAVHIARGQAWRGHPVRGGLVVYVALEGVRSAKKRLYAMRNAQQLGDLPLALTVGPASLRSPESVDAVLALVRKAEQDYGMPCVAVFVDTLSRAMAGGDENSSADMAALVEGVATLIRATDAAVILVHHLGKDETRGARGHSLLHAATDTELTVSVRDGIHTAVVNRQKDYAPGGSYAFRLQQVGVGIDHDGDTVTTCLVVAEENLPNAGKPPKGELAGKHQIALDAALREWRRAHPAELFISDCEMTKLAKGQGIDCHRKPEVTRKFVETGRLIVCNGGYTFG